MNDQVQLDITEILPILLASERGKIEWELAVERATNAKLRELIDGRDAVIAALQPEPEGQLSEG